MGKRKLDRLPIGIVGHVFDHIMGDPSTLPQPDEVRRIRRRLKLTQHGASELRGGGPRAFQKYESGEILISRPMANLLLLLDRDPSRLKEIVAERAA